MVRVMKIVSVLPADVYQVVNKSLLNESDKLVLSMLYMPIIGNTAVTLYNTLYNELKASNYISEELTHHHLMTNLGDSLENIRIARTKLEGVGLMKTFYKEGSVNSFVYELYSPLTVNEFFSHPIFNMVFYSSVGKEEYIRIKNYFKIPKVNLDGYVDITSPFDMTFKSSNYTNLELLNDNIDIASKMRLSLPYESIFDFDAFMSSMPSKIINDRFLTKATKELITNIAFLYSLDPFTTADIAKVSINEKGMLDKELFKSNARKYYEYNNDGRLPSLIFKDQPSHLKSPTGDNSYKGKMISLFENTNPYKFLKGRNKGINPTERDMKILEMLIVDMKLNPAVVNVLIDYVLKTQNNRLVKGFIETIASEWKRNNIETAKEAMEYAEKTHKKLKKYEKEKTKKEEKVLINETTPTWFDKNIKKQVITDEEKEELNNLLKEYV